MVIAPDAFVVRSDRLPDSIEMSGAAADVNGVPVQKFWKPMLRPGAFSHPNPKYGKLQFTRDYLAEVDKNTREFIKDGGKPFVPMGHGADKNMGWIRDTKMDPDGTLWGLHEMIGSDAILAAHRNDSSVCIQNGYVGGNGRKYGPLLTHNCLTPEPVAMGLGGFVAMSRGASGPVDSVPYFTPAAERNPPMPTPEELAKAKTLLGQPDLADDKAFDVLLSRAELFGKHIALAREHLGLPDLKDDEAIPMMMASNHASFDAEAAAVKVADAAAVEMSRTAGELKDAVAERDKARETLSIEMSRAAEKPKPSASELHWMTRAVEAQREKMLASDAISRTVALRAEQRFLGTAPSLDKITLSREVQPDDHKLAEGLTRLMDFYEIVHGNVGTKPPLAEITGIQSGATIELGRTAPSGEPTKEGDKVDAARVAELRERAGLPPKAAPAK